jgi:uncharacterized protein YkwD
MMSPTRVLRPAHRPLFAILLTALAAAALTVPAPRADAMSTATTMTARAYPVMTTGRYERKVKRWINVKRNRHGLRDLRLADCTDRVAESWSEYLASHDAFYHQSMSTILDRCNARYAGETLGKGSIGPRRLVRMWMHSPAHRDVLMSRHPCRLGIGAYPDRHGQWVVAADFMRF